MVKTHSSKEKILTFLLENKYDNNSIRNISKKCNIDYKSAYNAIIDLKNEKIINIQTIGNTKFCTLKNNFTPLLFKVEFERKKQIIGKKKLSTLVKNLETIPQDIIVLLFGSYVEGTQTKNSDIDLLIITEHEKKINLELELLPLDLHVTYLTREEFLNLANRKKFSVVSEVLRKNIILVGIEEYYRLMKNVK